MQGLALQVEQLAEFFVALLGVADFFGQTSLSCLNNSFLLAEMFRLLLSRFLACKGKGRSFCSLPAFENLLEDLGGEELAVSIETLQPCIHRSS